MSSSSKIISKIQSKIKEAGHGFFKVDLGYIVHQHLRWKKLFPRVEPYFSVKCQPDSQVIKLLSNLGMNFDCSSQAEIELVLKHIPVNQKNRIIFTNPFKFRKDMMYASKVGIELTSFDSIGELERLYNMWPQAKLMLRIAVSNTKEQLRSLSDTEKFGAQLHNVPVLLETARKMNFDVIGISFHVGIMCDDWTAWFKALEKSYHAKRVMKNHGFDPKIINIGGGFHGRSVIVNETILNQEKQFEKVSIDINKQLDEFYPEKKGYKIIATPGRHFVIGAYTLATQIIGKRFIQFNNNAISKLNMDPHYGHLHVSKLVSEVESVEVSDRSQECIKSNDGYLYILNDGIYGSFNILMFSEYTFLLLAILDANGNIMQYSPHTKSYKSKIYGPTCDTFDIIFPSIDMPELVTDNWLIWADMGAYTNASRTEFNGIASPNIYYYISEEDEDLMNIECQKNIK